MQKSLWQNFYHIFSNNIVDYGLHDLHYHVTMPHFEIPSLKKFYLGHDQNNSLCQISLYKFSDFLLHPPFLDKLTHSYIQAFKNSILFY